MNCWVVAVGAEEPLAEHMMVADFFRKFQSIRWPVWKEGKANEYLVDGIDGLGGIHHSVGCFCLVSHRSNANVYPAPPSLARRDVEDAV